MYRVIVMYGLNEPWYFFDDWKKDITEIFEFEDFYPALKCYKAQWLEMSHSHSEYTSRDDLTTAFWELGDEEWCDECGEMIQHYHGLALLEDWQLLPQEKKRWAYEKKSRQVPKKSCPNRNNLKEDETRDD
ncbi:MAG: DUF1033 family protein [Streptococcaceae bacterium]|nr:DUF1033 family protein [Streptococcaceae bacterium]MCL2858672.1 DUF1033 family protein [Streptococcaceae bacterium]